MPNQWDLTGVNIEDSYQRVLQTPDGINIYDGTGSLFTGSFTGSFYGTASWAYNSLTASYALASSDILVYVKNQSGQNIAKGVVVRITGSNNSSDIPRVVTASYENDNNSANTLGITYQSIANGSEGYVVTEGILTGINTNDFISGQLIYLGPTGSIIGYAPIAPLHAVRLGEVIRHQSNNGSIYVRIDNGYELDELHNVRINTASLSSGDLLIYSSSVWTNAKQLTGSYGLTGSLNATLGFTGSLFGTSSWAQSASQAVSASFYQETDPIFVAKSASLATTGSNIFVGNQTITGSFFVSNSIDSNNKYLINNNGIASVYWNNYRLYNSNNNLVVHWGTGNLYSGSFTTSSVSWTDRVLRDSDGTVTIDWENGDIYDSTNTPSIDWEGRVLTDASNLQSVHWNNRALVDSTSQPSVEWEARYLRTPGNARALTYDNDYAAGSQIYQSRTIEIDPQETLSNTPLLYAGQSIRANIDPSTNLGEIVYLKTNGIWYPVNQTDGTSTKMLGVCINSNYVLLEGDVTLDNTNLIQSPGYGLPVYIREGDNIFSTNQPASGYIRIVGHCYYENVTTPGYWIIKFKPSNDWYKI